MHVYVYMQEFTSTFNEVSLLSQRCKSVNDSLQLQSPAIISEQAHEFDQDLVLHQDGGCI